MSSDEVLEEGDELPFKCAPFVSTSDFDRLAQMYTISPNPPNQEEKLIASLMREVEVNESEIVIYNSNGVLVKKEIFSGADIEIDMSDLPLGVYFILSNKTKRSILRSL